MFSLTQKASVRNFLSESESLIVALHPIGKPTRTFRSRFCCLPRVLTGFTPVSTLTAAQQAAGTLDPGEIYEISVTVNACAFDLNVAHYLMFQAGNAGFTYEVLNYGCSNSVGTVVI